MMTRIDDAVTGADQLYVRISADHTEQVVDVGNSPYAIGLSDNRVSVQR